MLFYLYDNTYEGLLTAVFDAFARREKPDRIVRQDENIPLFTDTHTVTTDTNKATRVMQGLSERISPSAVAMLSVAYLSERNDVEMHILRYIKKTFASPVSIEINFADEDVLALSKIYRQVNHESMRMMQFVRFQKAVDGMFFSIVEPIYNVIPLCYRFFRDRYADQPWILYDRRRNYGVYYDLEKTSVVNFDPKRIAEMKNGVIEPGNLDQEEENFQKLWRDYLRAATIDQRRNLRLQRQHMPQRYWKYLTEKQ